MGIHLLRCTHGNERMGTFAAITRDVGFHVGQEQLHVLPLVALNSFR
jgi:hypothetical protein